MPRTPERKLVHLMEECAEVTHVAAKILRFGLDNYHPKTRISNRIRLFEELADLKVAIVKVERSL